MVYKETISDILVFKTNISSPSDIDRISAHLDQDALIVRWNIDLQDVDRVLRIQTRELRVEDIIALISRCGFHCEELPD